MNIKLEKGMNDKRKVHSPTVSHDGHLHNRKVALHACNKIRVHFARLFASQNDLNKKWKIKYLPKQVSMKADNVNQ